VSPAAAALAGALLLGALSTLLDFTWARLALPHRAVLGLAHGTLLLLALGLYLGALRGRPGRGAAAGALVGLLAAASFYALAPLLGYPAMFASWMALWVGFALVDARLGGTASLREALVRGLLAAAGSGLAFWAISDIWLKPAPAGPRYAWNLACWTFAFLPGFAALLVRLSGPPRLLPRHSPRSSIAAKIPSSRS
jgi:hypothetical protein